MLSSQAHVTTTFSVSQRQKMVVHVTWRLSLFHRILSKCGEQSSLHFRFHLQDSWRPFDEEKKVWCMRSIAKIMCVLLGTLMRFFIIKMLKFQLKDRNGPTGQLADRHVAKEIFQSLKLRLDWPEISRGFGRKLHHPLTLFNNL